MFEFVDIIDSILMETSPDTTHMLCILGLKALSVWQKGSAKWD